MSIDAYFASATIFWVGLAVLAQLINAGTVLIDKYVLARGGPIGTPVVYAFYVSLLSGFVLILVPLGLIGLPSLSVLGLSFTTAASYIASIVLLYSSLKLTNPSDVIPVVGGTAALMAFALERMWLAQPLPPVFVVAFVFLVLGSLFLSHFRFTLRSFFYAFAAGALFGVSAFLIKLIFAETTFMDGFFWTRMANVIGAMLLLVIPGTWAAIRGGYRGSSGGMRSVVVLNKMLAGAAFALTLWAIQLGSVSIVNALSGLQFVFLLAFAYLFGRVFPSIFHGEIHPHKFPHKLVGVVCIIIGVGFLFFFSA